MNARVNCTNETWKITEKKEKTWNHMKTQQTTVRQRALSPHLCWHEWDGLSLRDLEHWPPVDRATSVAKGAGAHLYPETSLWPPSNDQPKAGMVKVVVAKSKAPAQPKLAKSAKVPKRPCSAAAPSLSCLIIVRHDPLVTGNFMAVTSWRMWDQAGRCRHRSRRWHHGSSSRSPVSMWNQSIGHWQRPVSKGSRRCHSWRGQGHNLRASSSPEIAPDAGLRSMRC